MQALTIDRPKFEKDDEEAPLIIVGAGPVGVRMAREAVNVVPEKRVLIFGEEPWELYDRVSLSSLLAGNVSPEQIVNPLKASDKVQYFNKAITAINRKYKFVTDENGQKYSYSHLVLATGSKPHIPNIPGTELPGVYTFRDMNDVSKLSARRIRSRCTVIIGGGLLGLEAAKAMQKYNTEVIIIEHAYRLMNKQLSEELSTLLLEEILALGIKIYLKTGVSKIQGDIGVNSLLLNDGREISCDTLIIATGIVPNNKLALAAGLSVGRGIKVNEKLVTSDPNVSAIGECCEFDRQVYGLVAPGYEQATVLAHHLKGEKVSYHGSLNVAKLKLFGMPVFSVGVVADDADSVSNKVVKFFDPMTKQYRVIVSRHRRIIGAMGLGDWLEFERVQEAIRQQRKIWPWQLMRFSTQGLLWSDGDELDVNVWPPTAIVCSCRGISRGELTACISSGASSVEWVSEKTGASTVCGSCKPLISGMFGKKEKIEPQWGHYFLLKLSLVIGTLLFILGFIPAIPYASSVQDFSLDFLWTDFLLKQITGYTLAGVVLLSVVFLSLRKRMVRFKWKELGFWRNSHSIFAGVAIFLLFLHTGLSLGNNLNFYLMCTFLLASFAGVASALLAAKEHQISPLMAKRWRKNINLLHIVIAWPLPVLLGFHITSAYYF